jgi:hypothetical protein
MNKNEITNKLDKLHNYLDELEELIEKDKENIRVFNSDIARSGYNISAYALPYNKKLVYEGLIVEYEDEYFKPWQLEIYCQDYPNSQQFESDCEEFSYNDKEKKEYAAEHTEKITECLDAEDRISIEIHKTKEQIILLTDKFELIS